MLLISIITLCLFLCALLVYEMCKLFCDCCVLISHCVVQVLQVNQAGQMIHNGGQQIMVHAVPQSAQTIQVATQSGQALQQIQVVPVSSLQVSVLLCSVL